MSRTLLCFLEYNGAGFYGWQFQPELRTVQGVFQETVAKMVQHPVQARTTSRTDKGVHAHALPVTFQTSKGISAYGFLRGLNTLLPPDVAVREVREMDAGWDVRGAVRAKTYAYRYQFGPSRRPLLNQHSHYVRRPSLNVEAMIAAAAAFEGTHDFSSFRHTGCQASSTVREIHRAKAYAETTRPIIQFEVKGSAFLQHMVRIMSGTLLEVGIGQRAPTEIGDLILARDRTLAGPTLPACGLTLIQVHFDDLESPAGE